MEKMRFQQSFSKTNCSPAQGAERCAGRAGRPSRGAEAVCDTEKCEKTEGGGQQLRAQRGQSGASDSQMEKVKQYEIHREIKEEPQDHDGVMGTDLPVLIP